MERITRSRAIAVLVLFCMILGLFGFRMYGLQVRDADPNVAGKTTYTTWTRVKAARGDILDRYGNVLVTNRASYNLTFNNFVFFNADSPNTSLLKLVHYLQEEELSYIDHFPVTLEKPYAYTLSELDDAWQGYFKDFLDYWELDSDISAAQLMKQLIKGYRIPMEWSEEEIRRVIGLRFELTLRNDLTTLPPYTLMEDVQSDVLASILELNIPGLMVEPSTVREYSTQYAAHILGTVGPITPGQAEHYEELDYPMDAQVGQSGFEQAFEEYLHGVDGVKSTTVDTEGNVVAEEYTRQPQTGSHVQTTISLPIQRAMEESLEQVILDLRQNGIGGDKDGKDAEGGAAVAIEVKTGQILGCCSYPTYDPSTYREHYQELEKTPFAPFYNRAFGASYAPGSIFKMAVAIAAIDQGAISSGTIIEDKGIYERFADHGYAPQCLRYTRYGDTHGAINVMEALQVSCNYFFYEAGYLTGIDAIDQVAKALGLGEATGIELSEETGHRANPETKAQLYADTPTNAGWYEADTIAASIGQSENRFTPLQMAVYAAALANRGVRYRATFLNRVVASDYQSLIFENVPEVLSTLEINDDAYYAYTTGMRMVVDNPGSEVWNQVGNLDVTVAGKTGTAQHGSGGSDNVSFICYAPVENPQIAVAVFVEKGAQSGNIAQVARAAIEAYFSESTMSSTNVATENDVG